MTRREFMAGATSCAVLGGCAALLPRGGGTKFKLAMAGYTLNKFKTDDALAFCEAHGFAHLCVKNFHLPFDATPADIAEFRRKCSDHGVEPYAVGPIAFNSPDEARRRFDYAAALGVPLIVGVPGRQDGPNWTDCHSDRAMCELCSRLADWARIKNRDSRIGFCLDVGHQRRAGKDPVAAIKKYASRIFDGHVRCLSDAKNGSSGVNPAGRVFDYDGIFAALRETGYDGCLGLELANAFPDNPQWIDESRDYFKGLM